MIKSNVLSTLALTAVLVTGVSCTNMTPTEQGTLSGAAIGAGAGGGIAA